MPGKDKLLRIALAALPFVLLAGEVLAKNRPWAI